MRRGLAAALAVAGLLGACSGGNTDPQPIGGDDPTPAETSEPAEPTATEPEPVVDEPEDPFAVPDDIDVEYVQRVFDELFSIQGDGYREAAAAELEAGEPVPTEILDPLRDIAATPEYFSTLAQLLQAAVDQEFSGFQLPPTDRRFDVAELTEASPTCIVANGEVDFTATATDPPDPKLPYSYILLPADSNVTGWALHAGRVLTDGAEPFDPHQVCP